LRLFEIDGATTSIDTDITLDYVEVPILFRIHYAVPGQALTPKVLLGPYIAAFARGTARGEAFGLSATTDLESGDDIDPIDVGLVLALGADFAFTPSASLTFDIRAQTGFIGVEADDGDTSLFNLAITANVGVVFQVLP
jgi:hypothetical protein